MVVGHGDGTVAAGGACGAPSQLDDEDASPRGTAGREAWESPGSSAEAGGSSSCDAAGKVRHDSVTAALRLCALARVSSPRAESEGSAAWRLGHFDIAQPYMADGWNRRPNGAAEATDMRR